ncbi:DUF2917 domain-containing protein [Dechloromonas denitrificans]|uniref:DUF2917 domain-containing protein n=1 Tax=Dechloromonas denitrificans TaxID=281362 RepID=UPI001CF8D850|nr:DUF2917 domain-containing protein [Dechloromonas denitrificans]UCV02223.1 DUF2917 domain-containing protein [Dechloromonas denitrificans]
MVTYARFLLYPGEVLRVDGGRPVTIACERGELWLTAGRERIDHVLRPGERAQCPKGLILIEGSGVLSISPPAAASSFGRWRGWLPFRNLALIGRSKSNVLS